MEHSRINKNIALKNKTHLKSNILEYSSKNNSKKHQHKSHNNRLIKMRRHKTHSQQYQKRETIAQRNATEETPTLWISSDMNERREDSKDTISPTKQNM